ncbi:unnamed protein product [Phaeothamnion confervicola]
MQGNCPYGGASKCAFAHGNHDLRTLTLEEMESTGRIPNKQKFRCYPCITWCATGSCPYFGRCVFLHDTRLRGPAPAWLYNANTATRSAAFGGPSPFARDLLFWPDVKRHVDDGQRVPSAEAQYELDPAMDSGDDFVRRAVYRLWYSLIDFCHEASGDGDDGACTALLLPPELGGAACCVPAGPASFAAKKLHVHDNDRLAVFITLAKGVSVAPFSAPLWQLPSAVGNEQNLCGACLCRVVHVKDVSMDKNAALEGCPAAVAATAVSGHAAGGHNGPEKRVDAGKRGVAGNGPALADKRTTVLPLGTSVAGRNGNVANSGLPKGDWRRLALLRKLHASGNDRGIVYKLFFAEGQHCAANGANAPNAVNAPPTTCGMRRALAAPDRW